MRTVLVTGFEPFGDNARNPTADAVRALSADPELIRVASFLVLPVTWRGAAQVLLARRVRENARGCLSFGLANKRTEVCVERAAYNEMQRDAVDNARLPGSGELLIQGAPARLEAGASADAVRDALSATGAPVVDSVDPGRYVCNATFFTALHAASHDGFDAGFVHVPPTVTSGGTLSDSTMRAWMRTAILAFAHALK